MSSKKDYSTGARKIAYNFPRLTFVLIQINFWVIAILLFSFITYTNSKYIVQLYDLNFPLSIYMTVFSALLSGIILGIFFGILDLLLFKGGIQRLPSWLAIFLRVLLYPIGVLLIIIIIRYILTDVVKTDYSIILDNPATWYYFYWSLLIYIAIMTAVISFINQMNNMFGPGVLIPLLMGRYRKPREEQRFFMFLDLKSSATYAEELGHLDYSSMIRDCFMDLNKVLSKNYAEIYQYVGDEAVITWPVEEGVRKANCISLFFDFSERLNKRQAYYVKRYGMVPEFKAGLHLGIITAVEVGQIKREIAYHGDTINTAARIQSICNYYNKSFLISESVRTVLHIPNLEYKIERLGEISLKGKIQAVEIFSVELV